MKTCSDGQRAVFAGGIDSQWSGASEDNIWTPFESRQGGLDWTRVLQRYHADSQTPVEGDDMDSLGALSRAAACTRSRISYYKRVRVDSHSPEIEYIHTYQVVHASG